MNLPPTTDFPGRVLIVDADVALATVLATQLTQAGIETNRVGSGEEALAALGAFADYDLVLTDLRMSGMSGLDLLAETTRRFPELPVILLTAHGSVALAVESMRRGAVDFMLKPLDRDEVLFAVRKALLGSRHRRLVPTSATAAGPFVGGSSAMDQIRGLIDRVAPGAATVLLRGESGTGKGLAARAIHDRGPRRDKPFVTVQCAALPDNLIESELFGYEKGAFTGAACRKLGRVELAHGGTLFLDEIGDLSLVMQSKLLRLIQEKAFERLGGTEPLTADVRFVAATHQPLEEMVACGTFREDLYYRLNVVPIALPPLRARPDDIAPLVAHFCATAGPVNGKPRVVLTDEALRRLRREPWPGNVRQLQNCVERLILLSDSVEIGEQDVARALERVIEVTPRRAEVTPFVAGAEPPPSSEMIPLGARLRETERRALRKALDRAGGNRTRAAQMLGVSRRTLYNKLAEYGLE